MRTSILEQFEAHHRVQRDLFLKTLPAGQQQICQLLPLLLHLNHPALPGYQGEDCPAGITNYQPDNALCVMGSRQFRGFNYQRRAQQRHLLKGLYLLPPGSLLEASSLTELQLWLVIQQDLTETGFQQLHNKLDAITDWAADAHVVLNWLMLREAELLTHPEIQTALDNFYLNGLILAGSVPAWWAQPASPLPSNVSLVDFGQVNIPDAQHCFEQAYAAWHDAWTASPVSQLKQAFFQQQLHHYPNIVCLSELYKQTLGERDEINPYYVDTLTLMLNQLETQAPAQSMFYQIVGEPLSKQVHHPASPLRRKFITTVVQAWGWSDNQLAQADMPETAHYRHHLGMLPVQRKHQQILLQNLQSFAQKHGLPVHSQLHKARQALSAMQQPAEDQLFELPHYFRLSEGFEQLYLYRFGDRHSWFLNDAPLQVSEQQHALHRADSLIQLLALAICNGLLNRTTWVSVQDQQQQITASHVMTLRQRLFNALSVTSRVLPVAMPSEPVSAQQLHVFVNFDTDQNDTAKTRRHHISSRQNDPLRYSFAELNLIHGLECLILNNLGQWHHVSLQGQDTVVNFLSLLLSWQKNDSFLQHLSCWCPTPLYGPAIHERLLGLIKTVVSHQHQFPETGRFLIRTASAFWQLDWQANQVETQQHASETTLEALLKQHRTQFIACRLDDRLEAAHYFNTLLQYQAPRQIHLFFQQQATQIEVYLLDDLGCLSHHPYPATAAAVLADNLFSFFSAEAPDCSIHCHQLHQTPTDWQVTPLVTEPLTTGLSAIFNRDTATLTLQYANAVYVASLHQADFDQTLQSWLKKQYLLAAIVLLLDTLSLTPPQHLNRDMLLSTKARLEQRINRR